MKLFVRVFGLCLLLVVNAIAFAQITLPENEAFIAYTLRKHVRFLSDDQLEGRLVGSEGEKTAAAYIMDDFKLNKMLEKGIENKFKQPFTFSRITYNHNKTHLYYERRFKPGSTRIIYKPTYQEFYPLPFSGFGEVTAPVVYVGYGITSKGGEYDDYQFVGDVTGKIVILNLGWPERTKNPTKYAKYGDERSKVELAYKRGAVAVVFLNDDTANAIPKYKPFMTKAAAGEVMPIPVVFFPKSNTLENVVLEDVTISVDTITKEITGNNIIGFIDNHARNTIVIGAHYDHLGYNELGGSTYQNNLIEYPRVHNGADDNASGTAAMMMLGGLLSKSIYNHNNYLFIAFSGEEEGLLGSNYFTKNPTIDTTNINYMINLDMVGRLDTLRHSFAISGTGTSPIWNKVLPSVMVDNLKVKFSESGIGSSDHSSFYGIGIPALHFFTGTHGDYHKPSDDEYKINYSGMVSVVKYIYHLIAVLDAEPKLSFTPTMQDSTATRKFKVTLGVMPDYLYEGKGLRIDGTTQGKPASMAGLIRGDIILKLGDYAIENMNDYMNALGKFTKGESTEVKVLRLGAELNLPITF